jgi:membrane protease YdiL (CAAX protease family)
MRGIVIAAGVCAQMVGWWFVSFKGREVWHVLPFLLAAMGVGALLLLPDAAPRVDGTTAVLGGLGAGAILYVATRVVVGVAVRWEPLARQVRDAYRPTGEERFARSLVLSLLLSVPGEELFYRGLVQRTAAGTWLGLGGGALLAWLLYIIANAPSRSLPIIAGAVVGGFVWCALAWWSGGLVAPLASHMVWTGLMLGVPPRVGRLVAEPA